MRNHTARGQTAVRYAIVAMAMVATLAAFNVGARAGAALNGRVMAISVARVPMLSAMAAEAPALHTDQR